MAVANLSSVRLQRHFDVVPERLFDAWTNPETVRAWLFTTPTSEKNTTEVDAREGGEWTIVDRRDGVDYRALGEYVEIDRPRRLVLTFCMPQFSPESARIVVEIASDGSGSLLTLTHEPVPASDVSQTEQGWNDMFTQLKAVLGKSQEYGELTEPGTIRFERILPGPIERVWSYLSDSDKRATWLAPGELAPQAGSEVFLKFYHADLSRKSAPIPEQFKQFAHGAVTRHEVVRFEPPFVLGLTWGGGENAGLSEVRFELTPRGPDVQFVLTHRGLADRATLRNCGCGWHTHLAILAARLDEREPEAFWSTFNTLYGEYEKRFSLDS